MGNEFVGSAGHSAEYFGDTREFSLAIAQQKRTSMAIGQRVYAAAGGSVVYLVSGRKSPGPTGDTGDDTVATHEHR